MFLLKMRTPLRMVIVKNSSRRKKSPPSLAMSVSAVLLEQQKIYNILIQGSAPRRCHALDCDKRQPKFNVI